MVAFESGEASSSKKVLFLGGLTDGLFACPYVPQLHAAAAAEGWSLVQPLLSSSYTGYGTGTLARDTAELNELLDHLIKERHATQFALVGHSTGCQQSAHFCNYGRPDLVPRVSVVVLQASVSDREAEALCPETARWLALAHQMLAEGHSEELMPRAAHRVPITAHRYLSLFDVGGQDDFFSSDLSDETLAKGLRRVGEDHRRVVVAFSDADQYVPKTVDRRGLVERLCRAIAPPGGSCCAPPSSLTPPAGAPNVVGLLIPGANHDLSLPADGSAILTFIEAVRKMLARA